MSWYLWTWYTCGTGSNACPVIVTRLCSVAKKGSSDEKVTRAIRQYAWTMLHKPYRTLFHMRLSVPLSFNNSPPSNTTCAIFTGEGSRPCNASEPLWWALMRLFLLRPPWCWTSYDLSFPIYIAHEHAQLRPDIKDHDWVEVLRYGVDTGFQYGGCDGGGYGTWFFIADGSGVQVNVGRLLKVPNKIAARAYMNSFQFENRLPCMTWDHTSIKCNQHLDTYLCESVLHAGFDSVLIETVDYGFDAVSPFAMTQELVLCTQQSKLPQCTACPGEVDLRWSHNGTNYTCASETRLPPAVTNGIQSLEVHAPPRCSNTTCAIAVIVTTVSCVFMAAYCFSIKAYASRMNYLAFDLENATCWKLMFCNFILSIVLVQSLVIMLINCI